MAYARGLAPAACRGFLRDRYLSAYQSLLRCMLSSSLQAPCFPQLLPTCSVSAGKSAWLRHMSTASCNMQDAAEPAALTEAISTSATGKVMDSQGNFVKVRVQSVSGQAEGIEPPQKELLCVARGLLKKMKQTVVVGDVVELVGIDWVDGRGMVQDVMPRRNQLSDPTIANIDTVLLVFSLDNPPWEPINVTRFLVTAEAVDLPVVLVLNKADLVSEQRIQDAVAQAQGWGYSAIAVSVATGRGLLALEQQVANRTSVVAGPSGAGKSSIINALRVDVHQGASSPSQSMSPAPDIQLANGSNGNVDRHSQHSSNCSSSSSSESVAAESLQEGSSSSSPAPDDGNGQAGAVVGLPQAAAAARGVSLQAVGDVSQIGRGKHTTRNVTLLEMPGGGLLADTPGFNQPALDAVSLAGLPGCFPEIVQRLSEERCTFSDCQHLQEPGCVVRGNWERYSHYTLLHAEVAAREEIERARAISKRTREGRVRFRPKVGGGQKREVLLNPKSHRRESRRGVNVQLRDYEKQVESLQRADGSLDDLEE